MSRAVFVLFHVCVENRCAVSPDVVVVGSCDRYTLTVGCVCSHGRAERKTLPIAAAFVGGMLVAFAVITSSRTAGPSALGMTGDIATMDGQSLARRNCFLWGSACTRGACS